MKTERNKSLNPDHRGETQKSEESDILSRLLHAIDGIQHGSVNIHIQDGRIVQIDRISKIRLLK